MSANRGRELLSIRSTCLIHVHFVLFSIDGNAKQIRITFHVIKNRTLLLLLFCLQNLHLALSHPIPVITMVTALQTKKMKVLSVTALKAGKAKTAKLVSLIYMIYGVL